MHTYMREEIIKTIRWHMMLMALCVSVVSCTYGDYDTTEADDYCYIQTVTLGTLKRATQKHDAAGNVISTTNTSFSASSFVFTINQHNNTIENRDSLPYGSKPDSVTATITFHGQSLSYRQKGSGDNWTSYTSTEALDLSHDLELFLLSNDGLTSRTYTLRVNVHKQEADSLYWKQCGADVPALADLNGIKAFFLNGKLSVLGQTTAGDIIMAQRASTEPESTWEKATTGLPTTTDIQTAQLLNDKVYVSTTDGQVYCLDGNAWAPAGGNYATGLTLLAKTEKYYYALADNKILRSADATTWTEDELDTDATSLPTQDIRTLVVKQDIGNERIILVGHDATSAHALVWNKMWNESEPEEENSWMYIPLTEDNLTPCPRLRDFCLFAYDGKCMAMGGESADGKYQALHDIFVSQDYGITWRKSSTIHPPFELAGTTGPIAVAVDSNNFIWIINNAQVWRGRLNRLGFARQ